MQANSAKVTAKVTPAEVNELEEPARSQPGLSIVLPAYNEAEALREVLEELLPVSRELAAEVVVVDDGSKDATPQILAEIDEITTVRHRTNKGYGAAIKAGVAAAKADAILIMDADGQHDPQDVQRLFRQLEDYDMVVGRRDRRSPAQRSRAVGKCLIKWVANILSPQPIPDVNSGLRVFRREMFESFAHFLPDGFSLSTTLTLAAHCSGRDTAYVPIVTRTRKGGRSTVNLFADGFAGLLLILRCVMLFNPLNVLLPVSTFLFLVGVVYGLIGVIINMHIPAGAIFALLSGVTLFSFGLLADQLATLIRRK